MLADPLNKKSACAAGLCNQLEVPERVREVPKATNILHEPLTQTAVRATPAARPSLSRSISVNSWGIIQDQLIEKAQSNLT